jgi:hypothetical protein
VAKRVGRWLIKRMAKHGSVKVQAFVEIRIDTFRDRLKRARTKAGRRLRRRQIAWRVKLLAWLKRNQAKHTATVIRLADRSIDTLGRKVPWDHPAERRRAA